MKPSTFLLATALALLASPAIAVAPAPSPEPGAAPAPSSASPEEVVPGVSLAGLTAAQKQAVAEYARTEFCYCGCPHTLSECLRTHKACHHAARQVQLAIRVARAGGSPKDMQTFATAYYASFDRRKKLDVKGFGPPLGHADAPITLVEFSDFTCPYCRRARPALEAFVNARPDRVKLFFKPFPIESHPGAWEAAEAGEWARGQDKFWEMHDALFEASEHGEDAAVELASRLGLEAPDLRDAIQTRRFEAKIKRSQTEARDAGVTGTPSLFMDGRQVQIPGDDVQAWLEFALADEEEWRTRGGFERD